MRKGNRAPHQGKREDGEEDEGPSPTADRGGPLASSLKAGSPLDWVLPSQELQNHLKILAFLPLHQFN